MSTIIFDAHTRNQLIFEVGCALNLLKKQNIDNIIVTHGEPFGIAPYFDGFDKLLLGFCSAKVHYLARGELRSNFLKELCSTNEKIHIFSTSRFPIEAILNCLLARKKFSVTRTEEGIGSYGGYFHNFKSLWSKKYYFFSIKSLVGFFIAKLFSRIFQISNCYLVNDDLTINASLKKNIIEIIKLLTKNININIPESIKKIYLHDYLIADNELVNMLDLKETIIKKHPRLDFDRALNIDDSLVYDGKLTSEELVFLIKPTHIIGNNSSALLYAAVLFSTKTINLDIGGLKHDLNIDRLFNKFVNLNC